MTALARRLRYLPGFRQPARKAGTWGPLSAPVDALETLDRMRAQSLLAGIRFKDGSTNPGTLSLDQARDVLRWRGHP